MMDDKLEKVIAYHDRLKAGGELTEEEQEELEAILTEVMESITAFIQAVQASLGPVLEALAAQVKALWDSLPEELQEALREDSKPTKGIHMEGVHFDAPRSDLTGFVQQHMPHTNLRRNLS